MEETKSKHKLNIKMIVRIIFILYIFILCTTLALNMRYNGAPDEAMKYDVCKYLYMNRTLPHGGDPAVREVNWGTSYAFLPILSYIFSTIFMIITAQFTSNGTLIFISTRFVSVLFMCGYAFINIKIAKKLFNGIYRWLYVAFVTLLPQVIFLGSYLNNDSFALFSTSVIVYAWILGMETNWNWKSCIILALGIGACALSYYNAYGFILCSVILYLASNFIKKIDIKTFFKKGCTIALIAFIIAGWWFIRSFILYDGDIFALKTIKEYGETYAIDWLKPSNRATPNNLKMSLGVMLFERGWIKSTIKSFIGVFGNMTIYMKPIFYNIYKVIFITGFSGVILNIIIKSVNNITKRIKHTNKELTKEEKRIVKEKLLFNIMMIICIIIPISLSIYNSYFSDYQPQGRYIMPMIIPFMYFIVIGIQKIFDTIFKKFIKKEIIKNIILGLVIIAWSIMPIYAFFTYIKPNINL
ncbi:MAG: hypothetical protein HFJ59_00130 [Clostridia bacterium]|nr:hypothetical protein [Clostridia bacterium]